MLNSIMDLIQGAASKPGSIGIKRIISMTLKVLGATALMIFIAWGLFSKNEKLPPTMQHQECTASGGALVRAEERTFVCVKKDAILP